MFERAFLCLIALSTVMLAGCLIKERVVDQNGAGVAGVTVSLSGGASMNTTTNSNGDYQSSDHCRQDTFSDHRVFFKLRTNQLDLSRMTQVAHDLSDAEIHPLSLGTIRKCTNRPPPDPAMGSEKHTLRDDIAQLNLSAFPP